MPIKVKPELIKEHIKKNNLLQKDFAEKLGVSENHFNNVLAGRYSPSPPFRERLMNELDIKDWDKLFEDVESK